MQTRYAEQRELPLRPAKGYARVYRLHRGYDRWVQNSKLMHGTVRRVLTLTLTCRDNDPLVAQNQLRRFFDAVATRWGPQERFAWLEFQRRGAAHYHVTWLNPPNLWEGFTTAWIRQTWGLGHVTARYKPAAWWRDRAADYVRSYVKKNGRKSYQQDYEDAPRQLRTFACQRLAFPVTDLDRHRRRALVRIEYRREGWYLVERPHLMHYGWLDHSTGFGSDCDLRSVAPARSPPKRRAVRAAARTHP